MHHESCVRLELHIIRLFTFPAPDGKTLTWICLAFRWAISVQAIKSALSLALNFNSLPRVIQNTKIRHWGLLKQSSKQDNIASAVQII